MTWLKADDLSIYPKPSLTRRLLAAGTTYKFFRDFFVLISGQLGNRVLGFLAFAWLARKLTPESYGAVEYVVGLSIFFATIVDGGLGVLGTRRVARDASLRDLLAFQIPVARLGIAMVGIPAMALIAIMTKHASVPTALVWLFALSLLPAPWRQQWLFQVTNRMSVVSSSDVLRMIVFCALVFLLVRDTGDVLNVAWAEIAGILAMTAYTLFMQYRHFRPHRLEHRFQGFASLLREGAAIGSTNLVWAFNQFAPLFIIASLYGGAPVAWFAGTSRVVVSITQFSNLYHFNLYPSVARAHGRGAEDIRRLMDRSMRITAWAGIGIATALTLFSKPIIHLILGPKLMEAAPMLEVMAWTVPVVLVSGHSRWGLAAAGAQVRVLRTQIAGGVVTILGVLLFDRLFGVIGYAIGSLVGSIAVWALSHVFAHREGCHPPSPLIALRPALAAAAAILVVRMFDLDWRGAALILAGIAIASPLQDRRLIADAIALGQSKAHRDG